MVCPTKSGHIESSSLKKQHAGTFSSINKLVKEHNEKAHTEAEKQQSVNPWVLYSFRHTFLTRFQESGCDASTLAADCRALEYQHLAALGTPSQKSRLDGENHRRTIP
jgi:hypothetical protein